MVGIIKSVLSVLTSICCLLSSFAFGDFTSDYKPTDAENCKLNFAVISDIHMLDTAGKKGLLEMGLDDMQNAAQRPDALVVAGDITNNGSSNQYAAIADVFSKYTPAYNIIFAVGNHDTWNEEVDSDNRFPESERLFLEYNKVICNRELEKVYYTTEVNGYTFIVMGSEDDHTKGTISEEQLLWLDAQLLLASLKDLPIFVVSHWPLDNTHGLPNTWFGNPASETEEDLLDHDGTFSDGTSEEVQKILSKYDNVFLISGHVHNGLAKDYKTSKYNFSSVESVGNITSVNLPTYGNTCARGTPSNGVGFSIEVYENEVLIKGRCFSAGVWYTNYFYTIPLV